MTTDKDDKIEFERRNIFQLLSRRSLAKVFLLLLLLAAIVFLQRRSGSIARNISETLIPPQARVTPAPVEHRPPTVRMAPMPNPGAARPETPK